MIAPVLRTIGAPDLQVHTMPSITWMRTSGQTWGGTAGRFHGVGTVTMAAMMPPAALPMLRGHR